MTLETLTTSKSTCSRCEVLPEKHAGCDRIYLWLPLRHSAAKLVRALRSERWTHEVEDEVVVVELRENLGDLMRLAFDSLSSTEAADTRCLLKNRSEKLSVRHIPEARSLNDLHSTLEADWLVEMIEDGRFTSHFQPIVRTELPTEIFGYESLLRGVGAEGGLVYPNEVFGVAKRANLLFQTDLAARRAAIGEARRHGLEENLFINFTPTSIYDPKYCLRSTVRLIDSCGLSHEKVVFEVTESEDVGDTKHLLDIVAYYKDSGFKVALDDVGSGYSSLNLLHRLKPDFVKLDMQLMRGVSDDPYRAVVARKLLEMARELGTQTIAEGIETKEDLRWARENGATFAQGYFIARPESPPPRPKAKVEI